MAINAAMAALLAAFVFIDYWREIAERMNEKHVALHEEAQMLLPAIANLRPRGPEAVQEHVDIVCGQMREAHSPGHHIAVEMDGMIIQALSHHRASPEIFQAMRRAAESPGFRTVFRGEGLVVGTGHQDGISVYVAEDLSSIRRAAQRRILPRLARIAAVGLAVAAVVNLVFLQVAARPIRQLVRTVDQIAQGQLGVETGPFGSVEFDRLAEAVNSMSQSLAKDERHRRHQMEKAREIQHRLLPQDVAIPGVTFSHLYQPAEEVAGDYFDALSLPDGSWFFYVADVTGHGVPAAMTAVMLKTLFLHAAEQYLQVEQILDLVNRRFMEVSLEGDFATVLLVRWLPDCRSIEYASAGHESGWLLSDGTPSELPSTGPLLGVLENASWVSQRRSIRPGDRLLMVTDGVTEARNPEGELFGRARLKQLILDLQDVPIHETSGAIDAHLLSYRQNVAAGDDITAVVLEFG